ncbi:hypothetical protein EAO75_02985 [Streptomyces sp. uw30]|uniref:sugar-binding domain-containing protein n=1 Tax=Streptomyces sp. uw30 TaxID=1828179 RepID=UPI0011CDA412|nr:hypothetical protein EAO75_02985 [Streptomyces sp. uw30]
MRTRYDLRHSIVIDDRRDGLEDTVQATRRLGAVTADLLAEIVTENDVLGMVWGPEIEAVGLGLTTLARCTVSSRPSRRSSMTMECRRS